MDDKMTDLHALRIKINEIDHALFALIAERRQCAQGIAHAKNYQDLWQPGREESHFRGLITNYPQLPPELIAVFITQLMGNSLAEQGDMCLHCLQGLETMAQARFSGFLTLQTHREEMGILHACQSDNNAIGVVPFPENLLHDRGKWWVHLAQENTQKDIQIYVRAALPRMPLDGDLQALAVSATKPLQENIVDMRTLICMTSTQAGRDYTQEWTHLGYTAHWQAQSGIYGLYIVEGAVDEKLVLAELRKSGVEAVQFLGNYLVAFVSKQQGEKP